MIITSLPCGCVSIDGFAFATLGRTCEFHHKQAVKDFESGYLAVLRDKAEDAVKAYMDALAEFKAKYPDE